MLLCSENGASSDEPLNIEYWASVNKWQECLVLSGFTLNVWNVALGFLTRLLSDHRNQQGLQTDPGTGQKI